LKAPKCTKTKRLKLKVDELLSSFAFRFNLRRYTSGAAVMKGVTAAAGNVFVKIWCGLKGGYKQTPQNGAIPEVCEKDGPQSVGELDGKCQQRGGIFGWSECNFKFLNALDKLAADANLSEATPRTWTEAIKSFLPKDLSPSSAIKVRRCRLTLSNPGSLGC